VLANVKKIKPFPVKGQLRIFEVALPGKKADPTAPV